jgi:AraC family transcriptional regulator
VRKDADASALPLVRAFPPRETARIALAAPRFETLGAQTFVGLCEVVSYGKTHNYPGQWQRFMAGPYAEIEHKIPGIPVGINSQNDAGEMTYICAAEVSQTTQIPKGLTKIVLAPQTYVVFAHDDHVTRINDTYEAIWNEWFPASGKTPAEAPGFQRHNATFDPRTGNGGVTIWIPTK